MMNLKHTENVYEITLVSSDLIRQGLIEVGDSRELVTDIHNWAIEFETQYDQSSWDTEDYISTIEAYARHRLLAVYGMEK